MPNPILESQVEQWSDPSLAMIPILALAFPALSLAVLKPSLLQFSCKEALGPISFFHVSRPSKVARCCPSAMSENRDLAFLLMTM